MKLSPNNRLLLGSLLICSYLCCFVGGVPALYRPYDVYRPNTSSLGEGGTGVSNPKNINDIVQNPAYAASIKNSGMSFGLDAQARLTRIKTAVSLEPQYISVLNFGWVLNDNSAVTFGLHSPFQRVFPDTFFLTYCWEAGYAHTLFRYLDIGFTVGAAMGIEARRFVGWGFAGSVGLLSKSEYVNLGLFFRPSSRISYDGFSQGRTVSEKTPHILRFGASKAWGHFHLAFELEYIFWRNSSFQEFGVEMAPTFSPHFLDFLHPHLGVSFEIPKWAGLKIRTGIFTEDHFDSSGGNQRQVLLSMGLGGIAYNDFWEDRLEIDFVYVSSSIFSLFWSENHQIEKFQISFNYYFKK